MEDHVLCVNDLVVSYGNDISKVIAVDHVSFKLRKGKTLGVVGGSGSGKSSIAFALLGLINRNNGTIENGSIKLTGKGSDLDVVQCSRGNHTGFRGQDISIIFQEPYANFDANKTCGYQLNEVLGSKGSSCTDSIKEKAIQLLVKVGIEHADRAYESYPHELSGGQLQRVMIAIAIAQHPRILIADEPTTALDVTVQKEVLELIKSLQSELGMSTIFISHDLAVVSEMADDVIVIQKGSIVERGSVSKVFGAPSHPYTVGLLASRPPLDKRIKRLPVTSDSLSICHTESSDNIVSTEAYQKRIYDVSNNQEILRVKGLSKTFFKSSGYMGLPDERKSIAAVVDAHLVVRKEEVLGIVGESGSGKTTLGKCIVDLVRPDEGEIIFQGKKIFGGERFLNAYAKSDIQMVFQDPFLSLNPRMKIGASLSEPLMVIKSKSNIKKDVLGMLKRVGLDEEHYDRYPHEFSGGQRQRICIARALLGKPQLLICDEILTALDVSVQAQILNLIQDLKSEYQLSVLFISHDLLVIRHISDFIAVMKDGKIIEYGDAEMVFHQPKQDYTKKLFRAIPKSI
jgi:peptide/nickel transport system ATP-binding protein